MGLRDIDQAKLQLQSALTAVKKAQEIIAKTKYPHRKILFRRVTLIGVDLEMTVDQFDLHTTPLKANEEDKTDFKPAHLEEENFTAALKDQAKNEGDKDIDMRAVKDDE